MNASSLTSTLHPATSSLYSFFFNDTATTEIYTLSLHDALPISDQLAGSVRDPGGDYGCNRAPAGRAHNPGNNPRSSGRHPDRKSTRLNSSHAYISYAVFCLK